MRIRHIRNQAGDTIVEVLIACAIVSFILVAAYVVANKNTLTNQDTQERSQALQLGTAQLEFLHNRAVTSGNCFDTTGNVVSGAACVVASDGTQAGSGVQPAYTIAITGTAATSYQVNVTWDSVANLTKDHITLYYQQP